MGAQHKQGKKEQAEGRRDLSRSAEEDYLEKTLDVVRDNLKNYGQEVSRMQGDIDEMLAHYHDNDTEVLTILNNTVTMHEHMKRALVRNEKALNKPYFGRIIFHDEALDKEESLYIGKGGISKDATHWMVVDWRAPVANAYYENGLGKCSYEAPGGVQMKINLECKRTYEIETGKLLDYFDSEVVANDDLLTKYLAKNKQAVLNEIVATIQKEQNDIIRKSPYHNMIVQGVAGSGKTTVAMHRISYILYNYEERFKPEDFYIVGSNRILLNYITGVLPDLDVYGVRQMTMEQLFTRLLYEDWDDKKYRIKSTDGRKESVKGSSVWFQDLEAYCAKLEYNRISCKSVYLNPKQFVEGIRDGKIGVFDESDGKVTDTGGLVCLIEGDAVERYIRQNETVSIQSKINMLNSRLRGKIKEEFLGKFMKYTEAERKAILKAYRGYYGGRTWKQPVFELYQDFLSKQMEKGYHVSIPDEEFDVYDLAALAYLYKRVKETETISEAHHIVIDEAQDFGMMAYHALKFCIYRCTYTVMGDVSQNIHFGYGLNDWEELKKLLLNDPMDSFGILKKSYRNTVEISDFATNILRHGQFSTYPVEPIIRHGVPVRVQQFADRETMIRTAADICKRWQAGGSGQNSGLDTIAVVCRDQTEAAKATKALSRYVDVVESDPEKTEFGNGIMVLPVEYTKGLEFDAVLILNPTREKYPTDDGHAKLLYVAATRALHELCVLHTGSLTGLIADPVPHLEAERATSLESNSVLHLEADDTSHLELTDVSNPISRSATGPLLNTRQALIKKPTRKPAYTESKATRQMKKNVSIVRNRFSDKTMENKLTVPEQPETSREQSNIPKAHADISFGDMPPTEKLRPLGHGKIDLSVKWTAKQQDGLYLHSRYGVLRLSPIGSAIVRVTFAKGGQILDKTNDKIAVHSIDKRWMYKESGGTVDLMTDELLIQVEKSTGAICYMTRDKKLLLAERSKECRQIEKGVDGKNRIWLYLDWQKKESVYGMGAGDASGLNLRRTARYISHGNGVGELPFILSDQGYGIVLAADCPVMSCDIPAYGSYLHAESEEQMDFYFITGKRQNTIMSAYAYLCGKL
ncbi:MAG: DUF4968 domain-containing protein [Eubacterium sp.]|nr:DUF4968 domain-containing protein [Eubacterium sp.]